MSFATEFEVARRLAHVAPFAGLREKVDPPHTALLVIDMQNDFIADGGLVSNSIRPIFGRLRSAGSSASAASDRFWRQRWSA